MTQPLSTLINRSSRQTYKGLVSQRDQDIANIVGEYGITVTTKLTGWSKPTVIKAVEKYRPELLKKNSQ